MSAYQDAVYIDDGSPEQQLQRATEMLVNGTGIVVVNDTVALRPIFNGLSCEVIDPAPSSHRCEHEFEVLVENAQRMLATSRLGELLPNGPRSWRVVEDGASVVVELWRASTLDKRD